MQNASRFSSITSFILRAIFTSKQGLGGLFVALFGAVWWFLGLWQAFDFLQKNRPVLANTLDSFWGPLLVMVLGFVFLYRAVSARWPAPQPPETETRGPIASAVSTQNEAVGKTHRDPRQVEEETDEEFLIRRCRELAQELYDFLKERGHGEGVEVDDPDDPRMVQRSNETIGLYRRRFEGEVLARYEVLKERGWWGDELLDEFGRNRVETVTYYGDIRVIAQRLSTIGHRL